MGLHDRVVDYISGKLDPMRSAGHFHDTYVCCFCESGDLLSQWCTYGGGTAGYAIGFHGDSFEGSEAKRLPSAQSAFGQVSYGIYPEEEEEVIRIFAERVLSKAEKSIVDDDDDVVGFVGVLNLRLAIIKNPTFHEEREWRLIIQTYEGEENSGIAFRSGPAGLTPYVRVAFKPESVIEVVAGPGPLPQQQHSVRRLLDSYGFKDVEVKSSSAPLRF
ncbi:DUF2971 domain-containing protein [Streptomyces gilvosporeus]|uniref:DUF2971 domain-containing protein n=1 Tax=Streptomyces gilvosporeus TaxID=553510 RepID=UPI00131B7A39|nr:DUF2971 domain-containing protein [Streptomyces gilvosporeus]